MARRLGTQAIVYSALLFDWTAGCEITFWARPLASPGRAQNVFFIYDDNTARYIGFQFDASGRPYLYAESSAGYADTYGSSLYVYTQNAWIYCRIRLSGTTTTLEIDGTQRASLSLNMSGAEGGSSYAYLGDTSAGTWFDGEVFTWKIYDAAGPAADTEQWTVRPARPTWSWLPLLDDEQDYSGNERHGGIVGTVTTVDGPPVPWGGAVVVVPLPVAQTLSPQGVASATAVGQPTLSSTATIAPASVASSGGVGRPALSSVATLSPQSVAPAGGVGQPTLSSVATLGLQGVPSAAAAGQPTLVPGAVTLTPEGIAPTATPGQPTLAPGTATLSPQGVAPAGSVGQPTLIDAGAVIALQGIPSGATVGQPTLSSAAVLAIQGTPSSAVAGEPALVPGAVVIALQGIDSSGGVGQPTLIDAGAVLAPAGIAPTSNVGQPTLVPGDVVVAIEGIVSTSVVGAPTLAPGAIALTPAGIAPAGGVGRPTLTTPPSLVRSQLRAVPARVRLATAFLQRVATAPPRIRLRYAEE